MVLYLFNHNAELELNPLSPTPPLRPRLSLPSSLSLSSSLSSPCSIDTFDPSYALSEIAGITTDLVELLGSAVALFLLFPKLELWHGVLFTTCDVAFLLCLGGSLRGNLEVVQVAYWGIGRETIFIAPSFSLSFSPSPSKSFVCYFTIHRSHSSVTLDLSIRIPTLIRYGLHAYNLQTQHQLGQYF
ncbi:hypothetical protein K435DRAFT_469705 [Dendrothele bispora CBS 962.96]|uniref:Uncharacterized protein n=1 Tax=Dendrothele bispora (strain CBS 962.96) TaxID=1314807 RepID=A0A4S8L0C1_DENBC|nr:hypothetical protein K435DRAFT_469705 [Dendrothele bispora CBS 962.96]